jgi:hypothetical protein
MRAQRSKPASTVILSDDEIRQGMEKDGSNPETIDATILDRTERRAAAQQEYDRNHSPVFHSKLARQNADKA